MKLKLSLSIFVLVFALVFCGTVSAASWGSADLLISDMGCVVSGDGNNVDFSITVQNNGPNDARSVFLTDKFTGMFLKSSKYSINNGLWRNWYGIIPLGTIKAGTSVVVHIKGKISNSNSMTNTAVVFSLTPDSNKQNNIKSYTTQTKYTITATAGQGGRIEPIGDVIVNTGNPQTFTILPDSDYRISDVMVDGKSKGPINTYTFPNVNSAHIISASFVRAYTITATAGEGGSISPNGAVTVNEGDNQRFDITPNANYKIDNVLVDGAPQGPITSYTFPSVQDDHTITASFSHITHTITAIARDWASISPSGTVTVNQGDSQTFEITSYYPAVWIYIDGSSTPLGPFRVPKTYTFTDVQSDHTIVIYPM